MENYNKKSIAITLDGKTIHCSQHQSLWQTLVQNSDLDFSCAGTGRCGKCKIKVLSTPPEPTDNEKSLLTRGELSQGIRLACGLELVEGLVLEGVSPTQNQLHIATGDDGISVEQPLFSNYGIAIDIGTTTLVATLYNRQGQLGKIAKKNPQCQYGADVISRIEVHLKDRDILQKSIRDGLNQMIAQLCIDISPEEIDGMVITGNTTMLYILTGRDVTSLSRAPFEADFLFDQFTTGESLGLITGNSPVYLPRCICAFVGADITTALLASGMTEKSQTALLLDLGTNGEIALFHGGSLTCCATAAGPAFEGGEISQGMSAVAGAISKVSFQDGAFHCDVIGDCPPIGICGSGLIDAVAVCLKLEIIDETGALDLDVLDELGLRVDIDGKPAIQLADGVALTGADIRKIQLAKGAISAGVKTIVEGNGLSFGDVERVYIAGGFGSFLDGQSACDMGLLPQIPLGKFTVIGNGALDGAATMLCNRERIKFPPSGMKTTGIDLSTVPQFTNNYMECMMFL